MSIIPPLGVSPSTLAHLAHRRAARPTQPETTSRPRRQSKGEKKAAMLARAQMFSPACKTTKGAIKVLRRRQRRIAAGG